MDDYRLINFHKKGKYKKGLLISFPNESTSKPMCAHVNLLWNKMMKMNDDVRIPFMIQIQWDRTTLHSVYI